MHIRLVGSPTSLHFGGDPDDGNGHSYDPDHVGKPWELSGDIVFLANGGNPIGFATVRDCPNPPSTQACNFDNTLIEIDVAKLSAAGNQPVVKAVRGQSCPNDKFAGAGVTTLAPVLPPPPK